MAKNSSPLVVPWDDAKLVAAEARAHFLACLPTPEEIAKRLWHINRIPNDKSVTWDDLIPGEYGHALACAQADALFTLLTTRIKDD